MRQSINIVSFAASLFASCAVAEDVPDGLVAMFSVSGACSMLIVSGEQHSCRDAVMNTEYDDGRTGFIFINARVGGGVISFSGMGQEQVSPSDDLRLQPVDALVVDGTRKRAVGFCTFGNPFSGQARMECYAYLENGELYAGFFLSDGQAPKLMGPGNLNELGTTE